MMLFVGSLSILPVSSASSPSINKPRKPAHNQRYLHLRPCFSGRSRRGSSMPEGTRAVEVHLTCSPCQSSGLTFSNGFLYHSCAPSGQLCLLPPAGVAFPFLHVNSFSCFPRSHSYIPFYSSLLGPWPSLCGN